MVLLRATLTGRSALSAALLLGGAALLGCPQLLDDGFDIAPVLPGVGLDSAGTRLDADAGAELAGTGGAPGAAGAGGVSGTAGSTGPGGGGGVSEQADASAAGAAGDSHPAPDATPPAPPATELGPLLAHRYRFDGAGDTVLDAVGTANGTLVGTTLSTGTGKVSLSGIGQYVDLPNGLVSSLQSVTIEAWVNWLADQSSTSAEWQNVFDFGTSGVEGARGSALSRLYLSGKGSVCGCLRAGYTLNGYDNEIFVEGPRALPVSANPVKGTQVVLVADAARGSLAIYIDGALEKSTTNGHPINLSQILDVNDWLGSSQYDSDPDFDGDILDFRIYSSPLSAAQVALSYSLGADAEL